LSVFYRKFNFREWINIRSFPSSRPGLGEEAEVPHLCDDRGENVSEVLPVPKRDIIGTDGSPF